MSSLSTKLLAWYGMQARKLPWRETSHPYSIWVAEIMLQQTRVETVIPYYQRWMGRFPTINSLAVASEQELFTVWEGLGYYNRARNLHRAAKKVISEWRGEIPSDIQDLRRLPGIGLYTAAAIASIAFGQDVAAVDGNVRRVFARLFDIRLAEKSPEAERILYSLAQKYLPSGRAGDFNQALMDLGATVCTPKKPDCARCPLADFCEALKLGVQHERPVKKAKSPLPHYNVTAAVIQRHRKVLLAKRRPGGLLGGLWEFPGGRQEVGEDLEECLRREIREELGTDIKVGQLLGVYRHAYTHFRFTLHAYYCVLDGGEPQPLEASELLWVTTFELTKYPMGKVDRLIAQQMAVETGGNPGEGQ